MLQAERGMPTKSEETAWQLECLVVTFCWGYCVEVNFLRPNFLIETLATKTSSILMPKKNTYLSFETYPDRPSKVITSI